MSVYLMGGPVGKKFANMEISRKIEIRGDQTLADLHRAIFDAYDRVKEHPYEFQFGKRPFDPDGPNFGIPTPQNNGAWKLHRMTPCNLPDERISRHALSGAKSWYDRGPYAKASPLSIAPRRCRG